MDEQTINSNETVIMDEVDTGLIDAEVGETTPEELPEGLVIEKENGDEVTEVATETE